MTAHCAPSPSTAVAPASAGTTGYPMHDGETPRMVEPPCVRFQQSRWAVCRALHALPGLSPKDMNVWGVISPTVRLFWGYLLTEWGLR